MKLTLEQYARMVKAVREAQNKYFSTRMKADLEKSKQLEADLDAVTKQILDTQINLFAKA